MKTVWNITLWMHFNGFFPSDIYSLTILFPLCIMYISTHNNNTHSAWESSRKTNVIALKKTTRDSVSIMQQFLLTTFAWILLTKFRFTISQSFFRVSNSGTERYRLVRMQVATSDSLAPNPIDSCVNMAKKKEYSYSLVGKNGFVVYN